VPRFSRRSWNLLNVYDRRLVVAMTSYEAAVRRFRVSQTWVTGSAQSEFHLDFMDALSELRDAVRELRGFQRVAFQRTRTAPRGTAIDR
jgi:hypothetical protein